MRFEVRHNPVKSKRMWYAISKILPKLLLINIRFNKCKKYNVGNAYPVTEGLNSGLLKDFTMSSITYVTHLQAIRCQTYRTGSVLPLKTQHHGSMAVSTIEDTEVY